MQTLNTVTPEKKELGVRERQIIEVADRIFHSMSTDNRVSDQIRTWIDRLEKPVLKLALTDDTLFTDKEHIVRQVINKIADLELLVGDAGKDNHTDTMITNAMEWIVELIDNEFDGSAGVFDRAIKQLDILLNAQEKMFRRNASALFQAARARDPALEKLIAAKKVDENKYPQWPLNQHEKEQWIKRASRLVPHNWVIMDNNSERPRRLRVGLMDAQRSHIMLVNSLGQVEEVMSLEALAKALHNTDAKVLEDADDPAMDRAQYSILQELHEELMDEATHDHLTGLIDRREFIKKIGELIRTSVEQQPRLVVGFLDLDQFSLINNACGYKGGDTLIKEVATLLHKLVGDKGVVARMGSDEYGILLPETSLDEAMEITESQLQAIHDYRFTWKHKQYHVGLSIGLVNVKSPGETADEILQAAEASSTLAKDMGGNRVQVYHAGNRMFSQKKAVMKWATEIDRILEEETLFLKAQKILPLSGGGLKKSKYEILLGVWDLNGGQVSTIQFIEAAERYNRMPDVDRWVVKNTFKWMHENRNKLNNIEAISINLSGRSLSDDSFLQFVVNLLQSSKIPAEKVCFEVTETAGVASLSDAADFIKKAKATGCSFSLDDFGTGLSSYAYLKNLPVDYLKIDGSFVKEILTNTSDYAVVKSICEIGHFMGKKVIAEFVENNDILRKLQELHVDYGQGYGIEKPRPLNEI